jgi:hypothetical protein
VCAAKAHPTDDFLRARVVKIEPLLAVRRHEIAVDIDMFNALHLDFFEGTRVCAPADGA